MIEIPTTRRTAAIAVDGRAWPGGDVPVDFSRRVVCILGLPFDAIDTQQAVDAVRRAAETGRRLLLSTANLNFVVTARRDEAFRQSVLHSQLSVADGMPIVWISRLIGHPLRERVAGSDLFERLLQSRTGQPLSVYFFGGAEGVAEAASQRVNARSGDLRCVGHESPGFVPVDQMSRPEQLERINHAAPDFVVVSLGAQKGQAWIERNRHQLQPAVISHLGAVVGFAAGSVARAPRLMQRLGLEWLWRIKEEPTLWRRYWRDGTDLLRLVLNLVLPLWLGRFGGARRPRPDDVPTGDGGRGRDHHEIRVGSVCAGEDVDRLRAACARAAAARCPVVVNMAHTRSIDAFGIGCLLLLHGWQRDIGQPMVLAEASPALRRLIACHGADYLVSGSAQTPGPGVGARLEAGRA